MRKKTKILASLPLIILLLLIGIWITMSLFFTVDTVGYEVLEKQGRIEIRQYQPYLIAETMVKADFKDAGDVAFGRLFKYISGNNKTKESISMTAPVNQTSEKIPMTAPVNQQQSGEQYAVSFVMPSKYALDTLPQPVDPEVILKEIPAHKAAVIRYSGTWSQKRYEAKRTALEEFIKEKGMVAAAEPIFARYNPPFELWFLRRNEVIIPVE